MQCIFQCLFKVSLSLEPFHMYITQPSLVFLSGNYNSEHLSLYLPRYVQAQPPPHHQAARHSPLSTLTPAGVEAFLAAQAASSSSQVAQMEKLRRENERLRREAEGYSEKAARIHKVRSLISSVIKGFEYKSHTVVLC